MSLPISLCHMSMNSVSQYEKQNTWQALIKIIISIQLLAIMTKSTTFVNRKFIHICVG